MRMFLIAVLSSAWFFSVIVPAAAQDDEVPTVEHDTSLIDDVAPEKQLHAYGTLSLEQAIAQALRTNPELLIADAKVRQMKAELNRARLTVVRDVTVAYQNLAAAKQNLPFLEKMANKGFETSAEAFAAKQKLTGCEYELMYLLGASAEVSSDDAEPADATDMSRPSDAQRVVASGQPAGRPEIPQRYREVMKKSVELKFTDQPLSDILHYLQEVTGGEFSFVFKDESDETAVTLVLSNVTLAAALEALADQTDLCFVFRDYGVLVVHCEAAFQYRGAAIPSDTPLTGGGGRGGGEGTF